MQLHARKFFEAPGMTAAEARAAIAAGQLQPTWENGKRVTVDVNTGKKVLSQRQMLGDLLRIAEEHGLCCVLRIGRTAYTPQYCYGRAGSARKFSWHEQSISGFTYNPQPMTGADLDRHIRAGDDCELALLREAYDGIPMGGIVSLCKANHGLCINDPLAVARCNALSGRRFSALEIYRTNSPLTAADVESCRC